MAKITEGCAHRAYQDRIQRTKTAVTDSTTAKEGPEKLKSAPDAHTSGYASAPARPRHLIEIK